MSEIAPIPRIALSREEAAKSLGMSLDSFERHVQPFISICRVGAMGRVSVRELERWVEHNSEPALSKAA
jgi:hypothetical protein